MLSFEFLWEGEIFKELIFLFVQRGIPPETRRGQNQPAKRAETVTLT